LNCCNNKDNENKLANSQDDIQPKKSKHRGHMSHMKMMAICCGAPVLLLLLLPLFGYKGFLLGILPFICPIMMVAMMPMMMGMGKSKDNPKDIGQAEVKSIENKPLS